MDALPAGERAMVALAGPPGAGKSTLADALVRERDALVVPMDGFHLDNRILDARGLRARKGAPETFDAAGFLALLRRVRGGEDVVAPVFDRARDLAVAGASHVPARAKLVVVEGNYLLLDRPVWREMAALFDLTVLLSPPMAVLEERLVRRWLDHGLAPGDARARAMGNDIPNARTVLRESAGAHLTIDG